MHEAKRMFASVAGPLCSVVTLSLTLIPFALGASTQLSAQEAAPRIDGPAAVAPVIPQQVRYAGKLSARTGDTVEAVFKIYAAAEAGEPIWTETQRVTVGQDGSYTVLLGSATPNGLPQIIFAGGQARWLGVSVEQGQESERVLLASVPYAMKSADAQALAGHPVADFVTQDQLAALQGLPSGSGPSPVTGFTNGPITGSGTVGSFAQWTGTNTIGPSLLYQGPLGFGIKKTAPVTTLEVGGNTTDDGYLVMAPFAIATTAAGGRSNLVEFSSSVWSSTASAAGTQNFRIFANPVGNNTASPSAALQFQFEPGTGAATNILSIASNGNIIWSPSQTFPITGTGGGTITGITTTSPLTGSGTSGSVALGLNQSALITNITPGLETTFDSRYARLAVGNIFSSYLEAYQTAGPGNAALLGWGTSGSVGAFGDSDTGFGVQGESTSGHGVYAQVTTPAAGSSGVLGFTGSAFSATYTSEAGIANAGIWADNSKAGSGIPIGLFATGDDAYGAAIINNGVDFPALFVDNNTGTAGEFEAATGYGVSSSTNSGTAVYGATSGGGDGVEGFNSATSDQDAGVLGIANVASNTYGAYNIYAGVWGDTGTSSTTVSPAWAIGVLGTADDSHAGVFLNNSSGWSTMYISNASTGGTGLAAGGIFKTFMASSPDGTCGIGSGGSLSCTGQIKSLVSAGNGSRTVETYSVQSPENWMEDFGSGELKAGVAVIRIEPAFSETVTADASYHVFLTPNGDSKGLYVISKTPTTFEVRESGGGTSSLTFDYRIVAKRRGFETQRLVDVTERFNTEQRAAAMVRSSGIKHKPAPLAKSPLLTAMNSHPRRLVPTQMRRPSQPMTRPSAPTHP